MKLLISVASATVAYGGPAQSVVSLATAVSSQGVSVALWCADGSAMESAAPVRKLGGSLSAALRDFGQPDLIHDNGIWLSHNHQLASYAEREGIARVVSPRGMLSLWALRHKHLKKKLAWIAYQHRDLRRATVLHATGAVEAQDIALNVPGRREVSVIPNGLTFDGLEPRPASVEHRDDRIRTALFLGRIYPVKGLETLIRAWEIVRPPRWQLVIAGPNEAGHRGFLERIVAASALQSDVRFKESVSGTEKSRLLRSCDLFVLPSLSESFGMAVAEALAVGLPVIATNVSPWSAIADKAAGWWVPPTVDGLAAALRVATAAKESDLMAMGRRGAELVRTEYGWSRLAPQYLEMYRLAILSARNGRKR